MCQPEPVFDKGLSPYEEGLIYTLTGLAALVGILAFFGWWAWVSLVSENITASKLATQADCKSGAGCCRPRVQDTEDPKIECDDEDWRDDNKRLQR